MADWVCYLIRSLDSNDTYVGATNNFVKRLNHHNSNKNGVKRIGAKRTRGQVWVPVLIVSGFLNKNSCLSFESGWKRLSKTRNSKKLIPLSCYSGTGITYQKDTKFNRIIDLLYFTTYFTCIGNKFCLNYQVKHPIFYPEELIITNYSEYLIDHLPWSFFIKINYF